MRKHLHPDFVDKPNDNCGRTQLTVRGAIHTSVPDGVRKQADQGMGIKSVSNSPSSVLIPVLAQTSHPDIHMMECDLKAVKEGK